MKYDTQHIQPFSKDTIFSKMNQLAIKHDSINLGHGFPDYPAPLFIKQAATKAIENNINQYTSVWGNLELRQRIADKMYEQYGLIYNPETDITITHGATEAIFSAINGLINPGDEVILFEPFYTTYLPSIKLAGGTPRFYTLYPPDWKIEESRLASLFSSKTRLILVNTPHNPTGKVFSDKELLLISKYCKQYNIVAISDDVYENFTYDHCQHKPLSTYPDMYERTITVSNVGKTFEVTGWKIGWTLAPYDLTKAIVKIRQYSTGSGATPLQEAAITAMNSSDDFYSRLKKRYQKQRDILYHDLQQALFKPVLPHGTCFLMADISNFGFESDIAFCQFLTVEIGVTAIPASALYNELPNNLQYIRFAFCKKEETLVEVGKRIMRIKKCLNL
ncbi:MAG: Aminotransferase, class I/classII [Candidatus Magnetoglobus multicellularis str. Araruama]|uniref:Aminotransferase, class I/classII n=1 Tax=Candidatus Magnetoglobus multicellularis str. Araruama TaxID=890399 RepID=A0A1V1PDF5_9BACT|nr:MAG: Aminotransferase, class I/classII [Candidatus Magnetoglobus multicellularis str. Araruama]